MAVQGDKPVSKSWGGATNYVLSWVDCPRATGLEADLEVSSWRKQTFLKSMSLVKPKGGDERMVHHWVEKVVKESWLTGRSNFPQREMSSWKIQTTLAFLFSISWKPLVQLSPDLKWATMSHVATVSQTMRRFSHPPLLSEDGTWCTRTVWRARLYDRWDTGRKHVRLWMTWEIFRNLRGCDSCLESGF